MFPRRKRLARSDFPAATRRARRFSSPHFSLLVPEGGVEGYAVVVSKKSAKLSVARHRLRRRVLAALRALPLPQALVVYPSPSALRMNAVDLKDELAHLLSKVDS